MNKHSVGHVEFSVYFICHGTLVTEEMVDDAAYRFYENYRNRCYRHIEVFNGMLEARGDQGRIHLFESRKEDTNTRDASFNLISGGNPEGEFCIYLNPDRIAWMFKRMILEHQVFDLNENIVQVSDLMSCIRCFFSSTWPVGDIRMMLQKPEKPNVMPNSVVRRFSLLLNSEHNLNASIFDVYYDSIWFDWLLLRILERDRSLLDKPDVLFGLAQRNLTTY